LSIEIGCLDVIRVCNYNASLTQLLSCSYFKHC